MISKRESRVWLINGQYKPKRLLRFGKISLSISTVKSKSSITTFTTTTTSVPMFFHLNYHSITKRLSVLTTWRLHPTRKNCSKNPRTPLCYVKIHWQEKFTRLPDLTNRVSTRTSKSKRKNKRPTSQMEKASLEMRTHTWEISSTRAFKLSRFETKKLWKYRIPTYKLKMSKACLHSLTKRT